MHLYINRILMKLEIKVDYAMFRHFIFNLLKYFRVLNLYKC